MALDKAELISSIKDYIIAEFLPGESADDLGDDDALITDGILDSISMVKLVSHLEETYGFEVEPHEMTPDYLDTLTDIGDFVIERAAS